MMQGKFRGFDIATSDKGVATITFNQPDHLNGTTQAIKRDLTEALTQIQMDDDVRVVVITGTGRAFCAGDDMSGRTRDWQGAKALVPDLPRGHHDPMGTYEGLRTMSQSLILAVRALDKITIAAINGLAIQTGLSLALVCDFRIASSTARLGSATLRFGLLPDEGGHALVVQLIGLAKAIDFFLRKRIVTADEALELGLVHEVVEPEQLMVRATALAEELAAGPQAAMRMLKRSLYNAAETTLQQAFDDIAIRTAVTDYHPDAREGVTAFREKREARFS
jgi:2-(1,2-epoxy-1,2-dihydrophenyl)acetyl-CoA isomerase